MCLGLVLSHKNTPKNKTNKKKRKDILDYKYLYHCMIGIWIRKL